MNRLKFIQKWINQYCFIVLILTTLNIVCTKVQAQEKYDIRFLESESSSENTQLCFKVQIRSASSNNWELAGQNYRIYYNSALAKFTSVNSLLGNKYQQPKLVQDISNVDASDADGNLMYDANLGFLNYSIDLIDPTDAGAIVPANDNWLSTSEICFHLVEEVNDVGDFNMTWARNGVTEAYAISFVEISERTTTGSLKTVQGNNFYDLSNESEASGNMIQLKSKVILQGAYDFDTGLMSDVLRQLNYLPLQTPYSTNSVKEESVSREIFTDYGKDAIIDWVFLELRHKHESNKIITTRSALLQRDGDIVDLDGISPVSFSVPLDTYHVVVKHRNHLGIMTKEAIEPINQLIEVDFTKPSTPVFGQFARKEVANMAMLWGGNADSNNYLIFRGGGIGIPDSDKVFFEIFSDTRNIHNRYNHISKGYLDSDLNMDGQVNYQGANNEIDELIFFNVFSHPLNTNYYSNFIIEQQIPESE